MDKTKALQKLLNGTATKKEIELLKQALASGEISIGGDVKHSIVITGDGNNISLTQEALNLLKPETASEEPAEGEPPYMGLRYFDTSDAALFYGRESLTRELLARVQKENFLAIVGASGSGKSSVARAGLIPAWTKENERGAIHVITPTAHPLESIAANLTRESESVTATTTLMDDLNRDPRSLRLYVKKTLGETKLLLLVDQFEETFTLCKDADERKTFIENLLSLADDDGVARVVITLRADFYAHCAEYDGLRLVLEEHQKYIGAMTPDELRQAITAPAQSAGWDFQPGLVDLILQDVGTEPGALPLLSHALLETWNRGQGRMLTLQGYADAGGVKKAITQTAERVYDKLTPTEQTIARGIFLRLTELGEGVQDTRRRVRLDELAQSKEQDATAKVLKILTDARLLTTEQDSAEVAHEALIREWGTLRKWLDEDRENLQLNRHLNRSAYEWQRRDHEPAELYRGTRLKAILEMELLEKETLNKLERNFIVASIENERLEKRQRERLEAKTEFVAKTRASLDTKRVLQIATEELLQIFPGVDVKLNMYQYNQNVDQVEGLALNRSLSFLYEEDTWRKYTFFADLISEKKYHQVVAIPIKLREQTIGFSTFGVSAKEYYLTNEDIALVEELVESVGLSLENSRLLEEIMRRAARERVVNEINSKLYVHSENIQGILNLLHQEFGQVLGRFPIYSFFVQNSNDIKERRVICEIANPTHNKLLGEGKNFLSALLPNDKDLKLQPSPVILNTRIQISEFEIKTVMAFQLHVFDKLWMMCSLYTEFAPPLDSEERGLINDVSLQAAIVLSNILKTS